jgi:putative acetyltransferase
MNKPAITIRPYRPQDAGVLSAVFYASVRHIARRDYTEAQVRAWAPDRVWGDDWDKRRAATSTWVAECGREIAGFSDLGSDGHIDMLYVRPDFERQGIARALLLYIESVAKERGLSRLYTEASITARPVFEALGFHIVAEQTVTRDGVPMLNYRMVKSVPADSLDHHPSSAKEST